MAWQLDQLLDLVRQHNIHEDSKTIVDMAIKTSLQEVQEAMAPWQQCPPDRPQLIAFLQQHFEDPGR